jgi:hypothetical protein
MFIIKCPHCNDYIFIEELNCKIFRHGVLINNGKQIDPHSSKVECDFFISNKLIYGCGKPFRIIVNNVGEFKVEICEYI